MEQTPAERLEWILENKGLTSEDLERLTERSRTQVWRYLTGEKPLSKKAIRRLETALGVNPQWLMAGIGAPFVSKGTQMKPEPIDESDHQVLRDAPRELLAGENTLAWVARNWTIEQLKEEIKHALDAGRHGAARDLLDVLDQRLSSRAVAAAAEDALDAAGKVAGVPPAPPPKSKAGEPNASKRTTGGGVERRSSGHTSPPKPAPWKPD